MTPSAQLALQLDGAPLVCARETQRGGQPGKTRPADTPTSGKGHYRPIALFFKHGGFSYRQIAREGDIAIYEQRWRQSENVAYEVVIIRRHEGYTLAGNYVEPAEFYPSSEQWGDYGWTVTDKDRAYAKLRELRQASERLD